ncbi:MAG: (2Fe-2S) ferredoxin domain-containing protein [Vallitaleaceae bacterium]|jgi:NADH:ubiquinone oxidoreductase subunit E|nr:(2Fe-2S) ferredoxin domain-containing protein [Vallitaleaceae bacterium]
MIEICIGSACHLKGSYLVINRFKALLEEHHLTEKVELKSSFCLGTCGEGVSIRLDGADIYSITADTADAFFIDKVLVKL